MQGDEAVGTRADGWVFTPVRKAFYSSVILGVGALDYIVAVFLLKYYADYTGLDAGLAGLALLLGKVFDAVSDPVMGYISDRTKSRWGRRRPWFLVGAFPLALSFIATFSASPAWSETQLFVWLVTTNMLFWAGNTIVEIPHSAYASEVTHTHQERVSVMGWRQSFGTTGLLLGGLAMFILLERVKQSTTADAEAAGLTGHAIDEAVRIARGVAHGRISLWLGAGTLLGSLISFAGVREPSGPHTPPSDTVFGDFLDALRSRPFRIFALAFMVGQLADGTTATLALFAIEEWWGFGGAHPRYIMIGYLLMAVVSVPVWMRVARHFEKHHLLACGTFMACVGLTAMLFVPRIGLWWAYVSFYFSGIGLGLRMILGLAMMADIVDDDEVRTHTRKDGAYFGMYNLLRKLARSMAIGLSGVGLGWYGYVSGSTEQTPEAIRGIAMMFSVMPATISLLTGWLFLAFPITRAKHEEILGILRARRTGEEN